MQQHSLKSFDSSLDNGSSILIIGLIIGQLVSKANCQAVNSSKKRTNEFNFTTMRLVFVHFLEEIEDTKKMFRNYLTFTVTVLYTVFPQIASAL